jgi:plastocyanin
MKTRTPKLIAIALVLLAAAVRLPERVMLMGASAQQTENEVTLTNSQFTPKTITVTEGATVTWNNKEGFHTVEADDGSYSSKALSAGDKFTQQFPKAGKYPYHCKLHGSKGGHNMAGVVIVKKK